MMTTTVTPPETQLLKTLTSILTSDKTHLLETLIPYIPQITQPLLSSPSLVSFFQCPIGFAPFSSLPPQVRRCQITPRLLHPNLRCIALSSTGIFISRRHFHGSVSSGGKASRGVTDLPEDDSCNTLLIALVRYPSSFSLSSARQVFDDMVKLGISLNANTFNILVHGYCLEGKLEEALGMIERMVTGFKVRPDNVTYNTILKAMSKKGRLNDVKALLLDMKKNGLVPNRDTYNNIVYGYCKMGSLKEAFQTLELI